MPRESIVVVVCESEDQSRTNSHCSICDKPERTVNHGCAERKEQHADTAPNNDAFDMMSAKPKRECDDADRHHDQEHLDVKVAVAELAHKW